jgi:hypothetical protein
MELLLVRDTFTENSTIGNLSIDGLFFCYTLEDVYRENEVKVFGKTCIAEGRYEVVLTYSNRFKRVLPLLLKVKNFEGIRIHPGNSAVDTEGCILLGKAKSEDFIFASRIVFKKFLSIVQKSMESQKVFLTIQNKIT